MGDWSQEDERVATATGNLSDALRPSAQDVLVQRLLDQNDRLIAALVASSPLEIVKALNPPHVAVAPPSDPWEGDTAKFPPEDPWGDPRVPTEKVVAGWTDPPFVVPEEEPSVGAPEA